VWKCPSLVVDFKALQLLRTLTGHSDRVRCMHWSEDGAYLLTGSEDTLAIVHRIAGGDVVSKDAKVGMAGEDATPAAAAASSSSSAAAATPVDLPPLKLVGAKSALVAVYFGQPTAHLSQTPLVYCVSKDGTLFVWDFVSEQEALTSRDKHTKEREDFKRKYEEKEPQPPMTKKQRAAAEEAAKRGEHQHPAHPKRAYTTSLFGGRGKFKLAGRHYFNQQGAKVQCAAMHRASQVDLLVVGFDSGVFGLYELPDFNCIHTLSISQKRISSVSINSSGQWLAFGCEKLGQLLVWEWQSESYVLKQQGHYYDVNCLSFSPDGQVLATGGDDGKVKLWNTTTGFCFVTFTNHTAPVTACHWSGVGNVLLTSSMDGTVRAFDLVRYRNFRTLTTPQPAQLVSLAVDPAGEVICAGSLEPFEIYVWSLQTGKLLDVLSGHSGPLSCLSFGSSQSLLASSSWDKTVKLWDVFTGKGLVETFTHGTDVLCCSLRHDGKELCSSTLDGNLSFWDVQAGQLKGMIEGKRDIMGGRRVTDARAAENATHNTAFTSLCYSSDGACILAGGNSRYVCIYDVASKLLMRKYVLSTNLSLDGLLDKLNSKRMSEAGVSMDLVDDNVADPYEDDAEKRIDQSLPGAQRGDFSSRRTALAIRSKCVRFSPTGGQWAAATTDGLLVYSLDSTTIFDPQELDVNITPANVRAAMQAEDYTQALRMALSLNESALILLVVESTPVSSISRVVRSIPAHRLDRFVAFLAGTLAGSAHLEYMLLWSQSVMTQHATVLAANSQQMMTTFRHLAKTLTQQHKDVANLSVWTHQNGKAQVSLRVRLLTSRVLFSPSPSCNENTFTLAYLSHLGHHTSSSAAAAKVELVDEEQEEDGDVEMKDAGETTKEEENVEEEASEDDESSEKEEAVKPSKRKAPAVSVKKEKPSPRLTASAHVPVKQQQQQQHKKTKK
jgi:periodic tryptophan protein 2